MPEFWQSDREPRRTGRTVSSRGSGEVPPPEHVHRADTADVESPSERRRRETAAVTRPPQPKNDGSSPSNASESGRSYDPALIKHGAEGIIDWLAEYRDVYAPDRLVEPQRAAEFEALIDQQAVSLQAFMGQTQAEQSALAGKIDDQLLELRTQIAELSEQQESTPWSLFDSLGHAILRLTAGAMLGVLGGPIIAFMLHEPVTGKLIEGLVSGGLGGLASEIADPLDRAAAHRPSGRNPASVASPTQSWGWGRRHRAGPAAFKAGVQAELDDDVPPATFNVARKDDPGGRGENPAAYDPGL